jgi:hypothetical protein
MKVRTVFKGHLPGDGKATIMNKEHPIIKDQGNGNGNSNGNGNGNGNGLTAMMNRE